MAPAFVRPIDNTSQTFRKIHSTLRTRPKQKPAVKERSRANFRSITQEAMSRLERTSQIDAALTTKRDQKRIDEAIASGLETSLMKKEMDAIRDRILRRKK